MSGLFKNIDCEKAFKSSSFEQGALIGGGAFAKVYEVVSQDSSTVVAVIKRVDLRHLDIEVQQYSKREVITFY